MHTSIEYLLISAAVNIVLLAGAPLACGFLSGLCTGVLQAATQVQDQTLGLVPRLLVVFLVSVLLWKQGVQQVESLFEEVWLEVDRIQVRER